MDTSMKRTGKIIKELREKAGESQEQLAVAIGAPKRGTIARWENGSRDLKREYIIALASHFNVSTDYLLGLSDVQSVNEDIKIACKVTGLSEKAIEHLSDMQYCDFNMPSSYTRVEIIEQIVLSGHFRKLLNTLCTACLFAGAENLTNTTEYGVSSDGRTVNFNKLSKGDLLELYTQKASKEFNMIIDKITKEAVNNGNNRPKEE